MYVFGSGWCGWRGGEWMRELGLGFTNPVGTGGVLDVCLCFGCGGVGGITGQYSLLRTSAPQEVLVRTGQHWSIYTREASEIFKLSGC